MSWLASGWFFNLVLMGTVVSVLVGFGYWQHQNQKERQLKGISVVEDMNTRLSKNKWLRHYRLTIRQTLQGRQKQAQEDLVYYATIGLVVFLLVYFVILGNFILAILIPVFVWSFFYWFIRALRPDMNQLIDDQLPYFIDVILQSLSKSSDLKDVLSESIESVDGILKDHLELTVRQMYSGRKVEDSLEEFATICSNIWVYALTTILITHHQEGHEPLVRQNLQHLRIMIENQNNLATQSVTGKKYGSLINLTLAILALGGLFLNLALKYGSLINLTLAILALGGLFLNLALNPSAKTFFFQSFGGVLCLLLGVGSVLLTFIVNVTMMKKKRKGV